MDRAVAEFGNTLSSELDAVTGKKEQEIKAKRTNLLRRWIPEASGVTASSAESKGGFKDPATTRKG